MHALHPFLVRTLVDDLGVPEDMLDAEATFETIGLDSLTLAELVVIVQDRLGEDITDLTADTTLAQASARLTDIGAPDDGARP